jgi:hypothetical protein
MSYDKLRIEAQARLRALAATMHLLLRPDDVADALVGTGVLVALSELGIEGTAQMLEAKAAAVRGNAKMPPAHGSMH